jgi:hypothetical protein
MRRTPSDADVRCDDVRLDMDAQGDGKEDMKDEAGKKEEPSGSPAVPSESPANRGRPVPVPVRRSGRIAAVKLKLDINQTTFREQKHNLIIRLAKVAGVDASRVEACVPTNPYSAPSTQSTRCTTVVASPGRWHSTHCTHGCRYGRSPSSIRHRTPSTRQ